MSENDDTNAKNAKAKKLADEAVEAGRKALNSDAGKKLVEAATTTFDKAEGLAKQALDSDVGKQASAAASDAVATGKAYLGTEVGKAMAIGAAPGAVIAIPIPFIGPLLGAALGATMGYVRVITKKS